ncbi:cation:proton antiporter [Candidatus Symbiobacter mobilis]|uniref:Cation/H+ exchanger transmembrane domain-containing protein n=1 Tax=Candidatus Symbiobacter mobilis CR TaxID=946483 RepID=U5N5L9_9BURK|nr:cation:proton antiporter [Candidatus Symbiobacter mobilis]AGX86652.1 hypothetical protein Cenrod_0539 [Candidatus Symbiobacter mobilis CR]
MISLLPPFPAEFVWAAAIAVAWLSGELCHRWAALPRISGYGIAGFSMAASQGGFLPNPSGTPLALLASFAMALILFELGYRVHFPWLRRNPWLGMMGVLEALGTFAAVYWVGWMWGLSPLVATLLAALSMSTSPAVVLRVSNELRSAGQVTDRLVHLTAMDSVLAILFFKAAVAYVVLTSDVGIFPALWHTLLVLAFSAGLGALFAVVVPAILRSLAVADQDATVAFAIAVLLLTALTHALQYSPLVAAMVFGLVSRHRRVLFGQAQRNFGALGEVLTVWLFVFVTATLQWIPVVEGMALAVAIIAMRLAVKVGVTALLARPSGIPLRKGIWTGVAMAPMSALAILLLEQTKPLQLPVLEQLPAIAAMTLVLEIFGPIVTRYALVHCGDADHRGAP